ncbi:conserved Plasmodium protein, unknown function [Plasmodium ovale curtisi]|uniref:Uncharacterized protein n=1 Tax=Plasmodium ovale curtisi TaxID=864141 RepID=A0A1A8W8K2_PLAOA|nr:conserved Plasmodium protein, unknown function [Plasmodium ovale curtisi]SBS97651.1 conserved Plasmodium protein, unknown function [Plasmodium ovale curtisi]
MIEKCEEVKLKYYTCLNNSRRNPNKCKDIETELRGCSKTTGENYCIDEINNLMECSRFPDSSTCAKEFFLFRECNRPDGPHILIEVIPKGRVQGEENRIHHSYVLCTCPYTFFTHPNRYTLRIFQNLQDNKYVIAKDHLDKYNVDNATIGPVEAPERNNSNTASFLEKMKATLHLKNFKEKFVAYKW